MKPFGLLLFPVLTIALMLGMASGNAVAQNVGDNSVYFVTYYSYANTSGAPDQTVRIINDGDTGGNLWAAFYVFDDSEELQECCACQITPDGLLSESVNKNLTSNPLTGRFPTRGVIKVISSASGDDTNTKPTPGLRAWATHTQDCPKPTYYVTETPFADGNLTASEQTLLQQLCYFDKLLSGKPCSCTAEDHDF